MIVLGIETSCDETALAVIEAAGGLAAPRAKVLESLVSSQIKVHAPFGGVVPNLAKREHLRNLPILFKKLAGRFKIRDSGIRNSKLMNPESRFLNHLDAIAVTVGPGLEPALWTGIEFAKRLAKEIKKPVVGANHLEGHLYSFLLPKKTVSPKPKTLNLKPFNIFPAVALIVSGGHTILLRVESFAKWTRLGETLDDAAGEAFDKVARLLRLPYPGGPEIEKLARKGNAFAISFPRPMLDKKNYDFSFSGLKTAVLYYLRDNPKAKPADVAAGFEQAAVDVLAAKTRRAAEECGAESVILCGGVAANKHLRKALARAAGLAGINFLVPDFEYNTDNAAMIALAGYMALLRKKRHLLKANGNLEI